MPDVKVLESEGDLAFVGAVEKHLATWRVPCLAAGTQARVVQEGQGISSRTLALDTTTMGCPFDLSFQYAQPLLANDVTMLGTADAARRPGGPRRSGPAPGRRRRASAGVTVR